MARTEYRSHYLLEHWKVYTAVIGLVWAAVLLKNENWNHVLKQLLVGTMVHYTIFVIWILLKHWFDFFFLQLEPSTRKYDEGFLKETYPISW